MGGTAKLVKNSLKTLGTNKTSDTTVQRNKDIDTAMAKEGQTVRTDAVGQQVKAVAAQKGQSGWGDPGDFWYSPTIADSKGALRTINVPAGNTSGTATASTSKISSAPAKSKGAKSMTTVTRKKRQEGRASFRKSNIASSKASSGTKI